MKTTLFTLSIGIALLAGYSHAQTVATHFQATDAGQNNYFLGNVGIGTTSPAWPLHLVAGTTIFQIEASGTGAHGFVLKDANQQWNFLSANNSSNFKIRDVTAGIDVIEFKAGGNIVLSGGTMALNGGWLSGDGDAEGIFVSGAGRVGINTSNPSHALHLLGSTTILQIESSGTQATGFVLKDTSQQWNFLSAAGNPDFKIRDVTSGYDVIYFQKGGNVGLGDNTNPTETLHVAGTGRFDNGITYVAPLGDLSMGSYTNAP